MRLIRTLAFLLLVACAGDAAPAKFDPARDPAADVAHAVALASSQHKRVLVDVGGEWCSWCHIMDRFFAANADLKALRDERFVWLKVNYSKQNENEALLSRWPKVAGYPHLFVLDTDGRVLQSQDTSVLEAGNTYDVAAFRKFLTVWSSAS